MILRSALTISLLAAIIPFTQATAKRPTLWDVQQSCLKTAVQSGQDKASPMGVRQVCGLDALPPTISPESKPLDGPTGSLDQPAVDKK